MLIAVIAICIVALALRLAAIAVVGPDPNITLYSESGIVANNLYEGRGYTYDFYGLRPEQPLQSFLPPLYVALVYAVLRWTAAPATTLAVIQAILSSLLCGAVYLIALELSRRQSVALLSALGAACYPVLVLMVNIPHSLTLHAFVLTWALATTVLLLRRPSWGWAIVAGVLWGVIILGRPALLGFLPFIVLWLWLNRGSRYGWLRNSLVILVGVLVVILPWTIRNYRIHGQFVLIATNGGFNFWNGNNPFTTGSGHDVYTAEVDRFLGRPHDSSQPAIVQVHAYPLPADVQARVTNMPEVELDQQLYQAGLNFMREQPGKWAALLGQKMISFWWFRPQIGTSYEASWTPLYKLMYVALMILFTVGIIFSCRYWRRYSLLYLLIVYYAVTNVFFQVLTRFRWEIEPLFLIFASLALVSIYDKMNGSIQLSRRPLQAE